MQFALRDLLIFVVCLSGSAAALRIGGAGMPLGCAGVGLSFIYLLLNLHITWPRLRLASRVLVLLLILPIALALMPGFSWNRHGFTWLAWLVLLFALGVWLRMFWQFGKREIVTIAALLEFLICITAVLVLFVGGIRGFLEVFQGLHVEIVLLYLPFTVGYCVAALQVRADVLGESPAPDLED